MNNRAIFIKIIGLITVILGLVLIVPYKKEHSFESACYDLKGYIDRTKDYSFGTQMPLHEPVSIINDLYSCDCLYNYYFVEKDWLLRRRIVNVFYGVECGKKHGKAKDFFLKALNDENSSVRNESRNAMSMLKISAP